MGYLFKRGQPIASNLHRILSEQVQAARQTLEDPGPAQGVAIHSVRKRIKKIRALFRLVRSELKKDAFQEANTHYRTIGQTLSPLRDATVMINTLDKLRQAQSHPIAPAVLTSLRNSLIRQQEEVSRAFFADSDTIETLSGALRQAPLKLPGLRKQQRSFSVFEPNLKAIYRRGRKALGIAQREPSSHNLHELRKQVKTIWYHTRLLEPIWPGLMKAFGQELGQLGELLGDDHDFGVLAHEIESDRLLLRNQHSKALVLQSLQQQRTGLQEQLFPLANRLFAEKAATFVDRYRLYWKLWQTEAAGTTPTDKE